MTESDPGTDHYGWSSNFPKSSERRKREWYLDSLTWPLNHGVILKNVLFLEQESSFDCIVAGVARLAAYYIKIGLFNIKNFILLRGSKLDGVTSVPSYRVCPLREKWKVWSFSLSDFSGLLGYFAFSFLSSPSGWVHDKALKIGRCYEILDENQC